LAALGIDSDVVSYGSDFIFDETKRVPHEGFTFLYIGYLNDYKGVDILARTYEKVYAQNKNVKLILKGNDMTTHPNQYSPEDLKKLFPTSFNTLEIIYGNWPYMDLESLYLRSDCFVNPHNTFGMFMTRTALDARVLGLPVIVPKTGEALFWENNENLCDFKMVANGIRIDEEDMFQKMLRLTNCPLSLKPLRGWTWEKAAMDFLILIQSGKKSNPAVPFNIINNDKQSH
jgi:glycosyltransferase involved in cell wall biosynthesis